MAAEIKEKKSFGGNDVAQVSPEPSSDSVNIVLSFEDALKLQFSIGQALAKINRYDRATTAGKRSAVHICLFPKKKRITVLEGQLPKSKL